VYDAQYRKTSFKSVNIQCYAPVSASGGASADGKVSYKRDLKLFHRGMWNVASSYLSGPVTPLIEVITKSKRERHRPITIRSFTIDRLIVELQKRYG